MNAATLLLHQPLRPAWTCRACGQEYPCPTKQAGMIALYGLSPIVAKYGLELLYEAVRDELRLDGATLFARFVAWTEPLPIGR